MTVVDARAEAARIERVADMMCTGHALMRDRYARRAVTLDVSILALSTWLVALTFVEPRTNVSLTPFALEPQLWVGLLGIGTFFLSVLQLYVNWKERAGAHDRALQTYSEVKREARYVLAIENVASDALRGLVDRNAAASTSAIGIPDKCFLWIKKTYKAKVEISTYLDTHPAAVVWLLRAKMWWRDNLARPPQ